MSNKRHGIRRSIERMLFPELQARGFTYFPPDEIERLAPYGEFRRPGVRGTDFFRLQFDKYHPAHFRVCIGVLPPGHPPDTLRYSDDDWPVFELMRRGILLRSHFGVRNRSTSRADAAAYDAVVGEVIALFPEVEEVYRSGRYTRRFRRLPEKAYGFGRLKFTVSTLAVYSIPLLLAIFIGIALWLTSQRRAAWLAYLLPYAILLLAGWIWLWWRATRPPKPEAELPSKRHF